MKKNILRVQIHYALRPSTATYFKTIGLGCTCGHAHFNLISGQTSLPRNALVLYMHPNNLMSRVNSLSNINLHLQKLIVHRLIQSDENEIK